MVSGWYDEGLSLRSVVYRIEQNISHGSVLLLGSTSGSRPPSEEHLVRCVRLLPPHKPLGVTEPRTVVSSLPWKRALRKAPCPVFILF
jgi:hypothetical protein